MSQGVVFYNMGTACLARLTVAAYTLRKHYGGNIAILSEGEDSRVVAKKIADDPRVQAQFIDVNLPVPDGKSRPNLCKTLVHTVSPYDVTAFIDADTMTVGNIDQLFDSAKKHEFAVTQFSTWRSGGRMISKRIRQWEQVSPKDINPAIAFGPALNTGVFSFVKNAKIMQDWYDITLKGRNFFIPDEIACQLIIHRYPNQILSNDYNCSCKHDDPHKKNVKIIHFHGKKHCREGLPYNGAMWIKAYEEVVKANVANIGSWTPMGDKRLKNHLKKK